MALGFSLNLLAQAVRATAAVTGAASTYPNSWQQPITGKLIAAGKLYSAQKLIGA